VLAIAGIERERLRLTLPQRDIESGARPLLDAYQVRSDAESIVASVRRVLDATTLGVQLEPNDASQWHAYAYANLKLAMLAQAQPAALALEATPEARHRFAAPLFDEALAAARSAAALEPTSSRYAYRVFRIALEYALVSF
jgi:hypothetical protein